MLDAKIKVVLEKALTRVDGEEARGPRLLDDARRLFSRVRMMVGLNLLAAAPEPDALELACHALQLPLRQLKMLPTGKLSRATLRERAEQAAEMLVGMLEELAGDVLLDATTRLLHEIPLRAPSLEAARLLADAVNLEDFGATGMLLEMVHLARSGGGLSQLAAGLETREQYGYWEARLKDGFHFEPLRDIARGRLENTRATAALIRAEMNEDRGA